MQEEIDDFDSFIYGIAPTPKSGLVPEAVQSINSDDEDSYVDCSSEDEMTPVRKPPQKTQSRDLEKMMYGGDVDIMSPTSRARALQAKERAKRAEELRKKKFFGSRLRRGTIQDILAACDEEEVAAAACEEDEAKCKPDTTKCAPVGTLTPGKPKSVSSSKNSKSSKKKKKKKNPEDPTSDKPKKKKAEDSPTSDKPKMKKKKKKKEVEDPASDEPKKKQGAKGELGTSQHGNSLPKADPALASPTEISQSLPVPQIKRVSRLSAVDANEEKIEIDPNDKKIFVELDAGTLSALLSLLQEDKQSQNTKQSERSESRQSQATNHPLASRRMMKRTSNDSSPTALSPKAQYLSPRPYRKLSFGDSPRSERRTESRRVSESPRGSLYKREVDEEVILPQLSSIGNDSTRRARSSEGRRPRRDLSVSRHRRESSPLRGSSSHVSTRGASNPGGELSESRHRRERSPRRRSSSQGRTRRGELSESRHRRAKSPGRVSMHAQRPETIPMRGRLHNRRLNSGEF
jgi:hypothetical protein